MPRKTIKVGEVLRQVNQTLRVTPDSPEWKHRREGLRSLLEHILHDTGNYEGFGFLDAEHLPEGFTPGIRRIETATGEEVSAHRSFEITSAGVPNDVINLFPDETRRVYYANPRTRV